jgi:hypothetical protein
MPLADAPCRCRWHLAALRDGIAVPRAEEHMPAAVHYAARLLWALGVAAVIPDERGQQDVAGVAQPGGG